MATDISLFDYDLPKNAIAQFPASPRESAKLLYLPLEKKGIRHLKVHNFPDLLNPSDILIINNTKVFKARIFGVLKHENNRRVELFLLRPKDNNMWEAIGKPWKRLSVGVKILISKNFTATVISKGSNGVLTVSFGKTTQEILKLTDKYGSVPLPPYIKHSATLKTYQTSYAKVTGSVAAPTAGFHLTKGLIKKITDKGVLISEITLHVGLGTFKPVKTNTIEEHVMHSEWVSIPEKTAQIICEAKKEKRKIIAVGTTTVRALEAVALKNKGCIKKFEGDVNIFITPGFTFNVIDGLLTNFHLPKSTLIILVSALVGRERVLAAYKEAIHNKYRFFSFGDAMFIA